MIQISNDLNNYRLQGVITFLALGIEQARGAVSRVRTSGGIASAATSPWLPSRVNTSAMANQHQPAASGMAPAGRQASVIEIGR